MSNRDQVLSLVANPPRLTTGGMGYHIELWLGSENKYIVDTSYTDQDDALKAIAQAFEDHALAIADLHEQAQNAAPRKVLTMEDLTRMDAEWGY